MKRLLFTFCLLLGLSLPAFPQAVYIPSRQNDLIDAKIVTSYTALKAVRPYAPGTRAWTVGKLTANDGGFGLWYWDTADTTSAEDGGTILTSTVAGASGRWKRLLPEGRVFDPKWFGATGNAQVYSTASMTAGSATLTVTGGSFTSADVGKSIVVFRADEVGVDDNLTDLAIDASDATKVTSANQPFTPGAVGQSLNVTGGTGFTVQRVYITAVDATTHVATCSAALGTLGSTGGTAAVGSDSLFTTIAAVTNSTTATLAAPAQTTVTNVRCIYGTDDTDAINACVQAAGNFSTIRFAPGKYWIRKYNGVSSACIRITAGQYINIVGNGKATLVGGWDSEAQGTCIGIQFYQGGNHFLVEGMRFEIIAGGQPIGRKNQICIAQQSSGDAANPSGDLTVDHCYFDIQASLGSSSAQLDGTAIFGLYAVASTTGAADYQRDVAHIRLTNSTFQNCDGRCIEMQSGNDCLVASNFFLNCGPNGLSLPVRFIYNCTNVRVTGNYVEDCATPAIDGQHGGIFVHGVPWTGTGAEDGDLAHTVVSGNTVTLHHGSLSHQGAAISLYSPHGVEIANNTLLGKTDVANTSYAVRFYNLAAVGAVGADEIYIHDNVTQGWNLAQVYNADPRSRNIRLERNTFGTRGLTGDRRDIIDPYGVIKNVPALVDTEDWKSLGPKVSNLYTRSEDFAGFGSKTGLTAAANTGDTTDPYGQNYATQLIEDSSTGVHSHAKSSLSFIAGTTYTFSVFLKAGTRTQAQLNLSSAAFGGAARTVLFDLTNGGASSSSGTPGYGAIALGNGWYRCWLMATATADTAAEVATVYLYSTAQSYTGDGTSGLYVYGAQINVGPLLPYVPTGLTAADTYGYAAAYSRAGRAEIGRLLALDDAALLTFGSGAGVQGTLGLYPTGTGQRLDVTYNTDTGSTFDLNPGIGLTSGSIQARLFRNVTTSGFASLALLVPNTTTANSVLYAQGGTTGLALNNGDLQLSRSGGKVGFYGATPATQPAGSSDLLASLVTLGLRAASSNPPLNMGTGALTTGAISSTGTLTFTPTGASQRLTTTFPADAASTSDIDASGLPGSTWSLRVGRNTTASNIVLQIMKGDNTFTPNASFAGNGNSYVAANNGKFSVGTTTAGAMLNVNGSLQSSVSAPTYGATVTINADSGNYAKVTVTDTNAFTLAAPTNPRAGMNLVVDILNSSGGSMGVIAWDAVWKRDSSYANPANGKRRTAHFYYDGTNWVQVGAWSGDI